MKYIVLIFLFFSAFAVIAQQVKVNDTPESKGDKKEKEDLGLVKWLTFEETEKLSKENPKTLLVDFYTDWCGWCKVMMKNTFSNPAIADYINTFFYPVRFDAETKDTVIYKGKKYTNNGTGTRATHSLAIELLKGQLSYPTIGYIDEAGNVSPVPGYMAPADIEPVLVYFAEKVNRYAPFDVFKENFKISFSKDTVIKEDIVKWYTFPEAVEKSKESSKKILLFVNSKWNNSSRIMLRTTFANPGIAKYINENYYAVNLVAENTDTIKVFNQVFINEKLGPNYPHQIVITLMNKQLTYPAFLIMNEQFQIIDKIVGYFYPKAIEPILYFLAEDKFKVQKYDEFLKTFQSSFK